MKKNLIIVGTIIVVMLGYLVYVNVYHKDTIINSESVYTICDNGSVIVKQENTYNLSSEETDLKLYVTIPNQKNISIKGNMERYFGQPKKIVITIEQNGETKNVIERPEYNDNDKSVKVPHTIGKGITTVTLEYILDNPLVKYNDKYQLFTSLVDRNNRYQIDNLDITINLSQNTDITTATRYLYENNNIVEEKLDNTVVTYNFKNIKPNNQLLTSVSFYPHVKMKYYSEINENLQEKMTNYITTLDDNNKINITMDVITIIIIIGLFIYFIILICKYDYQNLSKGVGKSYEQVLEEINPVVGACVLQERSMERKDVIALLINLISSKVVDIETNKRNGTHIIRQNREFFLKKENLSKLDAIDRQVLDMFLKKNGEYVSEIVLEDELEKNKYDLMSEMKIAGIAMLVDKELDSIGANTKKVTDGNKILNIVIFIVTAIFTVVKIIFNAYNGIQFSMIQKTFTLGYIGNILDILEHIAIFILIGAAIWLTLEIIMYLLFLSVYIVEYIIIKIGNKDNGLLFNSIKLDKKVFDSSIGKVMKITSKYIFIISIVFCIVYIAVPTTSTIIYMLMLTICLLIVITDDYMIKHSEDLAPTFIGLKLLEEKVLKGSYLKEKGIEDTILWGKYLAYTFALGYGDSDQYIDILNYSREEEYSKNTIKNYVLNKDIYVELFDSFVNRLI